MQRAITHLERMTRIFHRFANYTPDKLRDVDPKRYARLKRAIDDLAAVFESSS